MEKKKPKSVIKSKTSSVKKKPVVKKMSDKSPLKVVNKELINIVKDSLGKTQPILEIPLYDPQTGEPNTDYENLTGKKNPLLENFNKHNYLPKSPLEPKIKNRFLVHLPERFGVEPINVNYLRLPTLTLVKKKLFGIIYKRELKYDDLHIELREFVDNYFCNNILNIIKYYNDIKCDYKFDFKVELVDPCNLVLEEWVFTSCIINEFRFGELDYSDDNIRTINLSITPKDIKIFKLT